MDDGVVRFGILGCANIARKMSRTILMTPGAHLHAIGSRSLDKAQQFARDNSFPPDAKAYGSYEDVLDDHAVDAVYIPLPSSLHVVWAVKAAERKKHVLLEKPPAPTTEDLDIIISACEKHGVQLMDCTMWMHHPRTAKMKELLQNKDLFGEIKEIHCSFFVPMRVYSPSFFTDNIRVNAHLDALGALGDIGWYCARAILWAADYELPERVTALEGAVFNKEGVPLSCSAYFGWKDGKSATLHCSFFVNMCMQLSVHGSSSTLELDDFVIPHKADECEFRVRKLSTFGPMDLYWESPIDTHHVQTTRPQEALMVEKFSDLVKGIKHGTASLDPSWPMITRKTQQVLDAVKHSYENGYIAVTLAA